MGGAARNGAEVAGGEEQPPVSKLQRVKNYFFDQGLELKDLPTAFVYHEVVGLAMAAGFWSVRGLPYFQSFLPAPSATAVCIVSPNQVLRC